MNPDINTVNLEGTAVIGSCIIPQKNVQNLEQDISTLAEGVLMWVS